MLKIIADNFFDISFPPTCALCGNLLIPCLNERAVFYHPDSICRECALVSRKIFGPVGVTSPSSKYIDGIFSCYNYDGPLKGAISRLKFFGDMSPVAFFTTSLAALFLRYVKKCDVLVPIPMHESALAKRGFNQSAVFAREISKTIHGRCELGLLACKFRVKEQVGLSADERMRNLRGAFCVQKGQVEGRSIIIIDDVVTTGATLGECAKTLKKAGANQVVGLTLARA